MDISNIQTVVSLLIGMSTLLGIFAGIINKMLDKKLKGLYHDNRRQYRYMIVDFAGDLHNGIKKTKDDKLKVSNHYVDSEMEYIKEKKRELERKESEKYAKQNI